MTRSSRDSRDSRSASRRALNADRVNRSEARSSSHSRPGRTTNQHKTPVRGRLHKQSSGAVRAQREQVKRTRVSPYGGDAPALRGEGQQLGRQRKRTNASSRSASSHASFTRSRQTSRQQNTGTPRKPVRVSGRSGVNKNVQPRLRVDEDSARQRRRAQAPSLRSVENNRRSAQSAQSLATPQKKYCSQSAKKSSTSPACPSSSRFFAVCSWLWSKSKIASLVIVVVLLLGIAGGADALINMNRIYQGVSVGSIDLSGKTVEEATALISQEYDQRINDNDVVLCASEEVAQQAQSNTLKSDSLEEQISYEESLAQRDRWTIDSEVLGATFDPETYAQQAYQVGRDDGWLPTRLIAQFSGIDIEPSCTFNETTLSALRDEIIAALGTKMVNFNVEMNNGSAQVTDGNDGYEVSEEWLVEKLNEGLLHDEGESCFVIDMQDVSMRIDRDGAQACATQIDNSIAAGITFQYEGNQWYADREQLAQCITTEVVQEGSGFVLKPLFDESVANQVIIQGFGFGYGGSDYTVQFNNNDGEIVVTTNATGTVPHVSEALANLNDTFFGTAQKTSAPVVDIPSVEVPETMSFDEAYNYGLIVEISSYTTQYASGAEARNNNIHVAADALNNSICKAGETWSFLALSGEATADKGYQEAGAIIGGEYSDAIGGGICQVATTVFNAVYDSGYPIERRYNHSLYIASYPDGRDAAISYPEKDLVWQNDTDSDVLLVMSYTNSSVTATLYGVDPGYEVTTTYGDWQVGESYRTITRQDSDYPAGTEFVESSGTNGRSITIVRTVKDKDGNIVQEKEFQSTYNPKNKVIVQGTAQSSAS